MKDLGFNEFGELAQGNDEESMVGKNGGTSEMTQINSSTQNANPYMNQDDPEGDEEAEDTEIAIWWKFEQKQNSKLKKPYM